MIRDSVIFCSEKHRIGNALRRCHLNRNSRFLLRNSISMSQTPKENRDTSRIVVCCHIP